MSLATNLSRAFRKIGADSRRARRKLDFFCVGAMKAGTTSLHHQLIRHPHIELFSRKELHYFDKDVYFGPDHGPVAGDYRDIHGRFFFDRPLTGEITPLYLYWRPALERIRAYNRDAKIIVLLRNPVSRTYSHWAHLVRRSQEPESPGSHPGSFQEWIEGELDLLRKDPDFQHVRWSGIGRSRYAAQIRRVKTLFPSDQVLYIKSEDYFADQSGLGDRICLFLGAAPLSSFGPGARIHRNVGEASAISEEDWLFARQHLVSEIAAVEEELAWDCSDWRLPPNRMAERI